jgi:hypothetical protein
MPPIRRSVAVAHHIGRTGQIHTPHIQQLHEPRIVRSERTAVKQAAVFVTIGNCRELVLSK